MNVLDWAYSLFFQDDLKSKLFYPHQLDFSLEVRDENIKKALFAKPARSSLIAFSQVREKFPKGDTLLTKKGQAIALHSFANHELLAIEIMAMSLLKFAREQEKWQLPLSFFKGVAKTIGDEQKHFKLYRSLLVKRDYQFGDFPLNDFFWKWAKKISTPQEYLTMMALTFEGANLDFAHYFWTFFDRHQEKEMARILKIVYEDEISHVALGVKYLNRWRNKQELWQYYCENLIFPITPARAKGIKFYKEARRKAGLDEDFITQLEYYRDKFRVTDRKEWKK